MGEEFLLRTQLCRHLALLYRFLPVGERDGERKRAFVVVLVSCEFKADVTVWNKEPLCATRVSLYHTASGIAGSLVVDRSR